MVRIVDETLKTLGFASRRNYGRGVTEFEVVSPSHFLVRTEDLTRERPGFGLRSKWRIESAIEVTRTVGAEDSESEVVRSVSEFLAALRAAAPTEPWKGLGMLSSNSEKENWERLGEL